MRRNPRLFLGEKRHSRSSAIDDRIRWYEASIRIIVDNWRVNIINHSKRKVSPKRGAGWNKIMRNQRAEDTWRNFCLQVIVVRAACSTFISIQWNYKNFISLEDGAVSTRVSLVALTIHHDWLTPRQGLLQAADNTAALVPARESTLYDNFFLRAMYDVLSKVAFRGLGFAEGVPLRATRERAPPCLQVCTGKSIPHRTLCARWSRPLHSGSHAFRDACSLSNSGTGAADKPH